MMAYAIWNQLEVAVVLSGINSEEMVDDNIKTASETEIGELTANDEEMLKQVVRAINAKMKVPCTGCGYCMPCPQNINISGIFSAYNRSYTDNRFAGFKDYVKNTTTQQYAPASKCIGCGKCETHCPQSIDIRKYLNDAEKELEGPAYKLVSNVKSVFKKKN